MRARMHVPAYAHAHEVNSREHPPGVLTRFCKTSTKAQVIFRARESL